MFFAFSCYYLCTILHTLNKNIVTVIVSVSSATLGYFEIKNEIKIKILRATDEQNFFSIWHSDFGAFFKTSLLITEIPEKVAMLPVLSAATSISESAP